MSLQTGEQQDGTLSAHTTETVLFQTGKDTLSWHFWGSSVGRTEHLFSVMDALVLSDSGRMTENHEARASGTETLC